MENPDLLLKEYKQRIMLGLHLKRLKLPVYSFVELLQFFK